MDWFVGSCWHSAIAGAFHSEFVSLFHASEVVEGFDGHGTLAGAKPLALFQVRPVGDTGTHSAIRQGVHLDFMPPG